MNDGKNKGTNGRQRTSLPYKGSVTNWRQYSTTQDVELTSPSSRLGRTWVICLEAMDYGTGRGCVTWQWRNLVRRDGHNPHSTRQCHLERMTRRAVYRCVFPPPKHTPPSKTAPKLQLGDASHDNSKLWNSWKTRSCKCHRLEETWGHMTARCNGVSGVRC